MIGTKVRALADRGAPCRAACVFPSSRGAGGVPVDRQQRAVQDHERFRPGRLHRLGQGRCESGQDFYGLADVPVGGRDADSEPGGKLSVAGSPRPGSARGSGTSALTSPVRRVFPNPEAPAQVGFS